MEANLERRRESEEAVSEPKPVSKERREQIENWLRPSSGGFRVAKEAQFVRELLADAQYWREAVKNSVAAFYAGGTTYCAYCRNGISRNFPSSEPLEGHKPDCAWVKARE